MIWSMLNLTTGHIMYECAGVNASAAFLVQIDGADAWVCTDIQGARTKVMTLASGKCVRTFTGITNPRPRGATSPTTVLLSSKFATFSVLYDLTKNERIRRVACGLQDHVCFFPESGFFATTSSGGTRIHIRDATTGKTTHEIREDCHSRCIKALVRAGPCNEGEEMITALFTDNSLTTWFARTGTKVSSSHIRDDIITVLKTNSDGHLMAVGTNSIRVWAAS